jgi:hypothetical protein
MIVAFEFKGRRPGCLSCLNRKSSHASAQRLAVDCDPVHTHTIEGRKIPLRDHILPQGRAHALHERQGFNRRAGQPGADGLFGLLRGQEIYTVH